jgi:hypothetical protein
VDDVEDILGDSGVDPVDDAVVDHTPLGVALRHWQWSGDVRFESELAGDGVGTWARMFTVCTMAAVAD